MSISNDIHLQRHTVHIDPQSMHIRKIILNDRRYEEWALKDTDAKAQRGSITYNISVTFSTPNEKPSCSQDNFELSTSQLAEHEKNGVFIVDLR